MEITACDIFLNGSAIPVVDLTKSNMLVFTLNVNQASVISPRLLSDFTVNSTCWQLWGRTQISSQNCI